MKVTNMFTFKRVEADDEGEDASWELLYFGVKTDISIQDCKSYTGYYAVGRWVEAEEALYHHGEFRALTTAKTAAINAFISEQEKQK